METVSFICTVYKHELSLVQRMVDSVDEVMQYCPDFKYDFLIVDNSEDKGRYANLKTEHVNSKIINVDVNSGYCGGNNVGIKHSESTYIFIINPDVIVKDSLCIDWMIGIAKLNQAISGWLVGTNDWYTYAATFPTESKYEPLQLPYYPAEPTLNKPGRWRAFKYIDGSFMCFPRNLAVDIGGFDDSIHPGYFGENAFCFKAFLAGYDIVNANVKGHYIHKHDARSNEEQLNIYNWSKAGRQLFYEKYALPNWDKFIEYMNK